MATRLSALRFWERRPALGLPARPLAVFALSFALVEIVESIFRRHAIGGVYFQGLTSETLMQSVSLRELRAAPLESLWYLHVQPPVTNLIRALLVVFHRGANWDEVMRGVDRDLNHVWALAAAALAMLTDSWLRRLRVSGALAALFTLGWLLHPAAFAYATLLDGTLLSALFTTWVLYETWRFGSGDGGSVGRLSAAVLLAYFTRSLFQWPFVVVMLASLLLLRVPRRQLLTFGVVVGLTVGLYSMKQAYLFGTVSTSTLQGTNLSRSIGADCGPIVPVAVAHRAPLTAPVLTEPRKLDGSENFNHVDWLSIESQLLGCFRRTLAQRTPAALWASYRSNFDLFVEPSSAYSRNEIVDRLPWRTRVDWIFSGPRLILVGARRLFVEHLAIAAAPPLPAGAAAAGGLRPGRQHRRGAWREQSIQILSRAGPLRAGPGATPPRGAPGIRARRRRRRAVAARGGYCARSRRSSSASSTASGSSASRRSSSVIAASGCPVWA